MNSFIIYLFEVSICLTLFYLLYAVFKGETFHSLKRIYLIFTILISLIIPQVSTPTLPVDFEQLVVTEPIQESDNIIYKDTFEKVVFGQIPENYLNPKNKFVLSLYNLLIIFYLIGVVYFIYKLLKNIFCIYHLYRHNKKGKYLNSRIIQLPADYPTFSFFNCIFFNNKNLTKKDKNDIILHELVHIKQHHSIDILFVEICRIIFWFNPIIWLYKSSIVKVHECLADQYFIKKNPNSIIDYQSLLLKQYLSKIHIGLAHPFNYSLIKYRIKMMTKNKSKWWAKYKLIFALPIMALGIMAFSNENLNLDIKTNTQDNYFEPNPRGMVFIPQGKFTLNRTNGNTANDFEVSIDAFWMKETEVRVEEYNTYLESIKKDSTKQVYEAALPNVDNAPFKNYFENEKYKSFPMVGISLLQAQNYCEWMTRKENQKLKKEGKHLIADYRIPVEVEWVYASFGGLKPEDIEKPSDSGLIEIKRGREIRKYRNDFGLISMFSNVSEWTYSAFEPGRYMNEFQTYPNKSLDKIIVRGENYKKELVNDKLIIDGNSSYDYIGFRYVRTYMGKP